MQVSNLFRQGKTPGLWPNASFLSALVVGIDYLGHSSVAWAAEATADLMQPKQYPGSQVFTFLFLMLGPFKIIGPFCRS